MNKEMIGAIAHFKPYDNPNREIQWGYICQVDDYRALANIPTQYDYAVFIQSFNSDHLRYMFFSSERGTIWDIVVD
jgi:hypothetical protein